MIHSHSRAFEVCILLPCFNNLDGLIKSLNSIHFFAGRLAIVVVDDGSSIPVTPLLLDGHVTGTNTIEIVRLPVNQGITHALNAGLNFIFSNYEVNYIARLDCADLCTPDRFYKQVSFLNNNTEIDLLGSWCYFKNPRTGEGYKYITPTQHKLIKRSMYFRNVFIHPTVMMRSRSLTAFRYPYQYPYAEDYGLFYDIVSKCKTAVVAEYLVTCEINPEGLSFGNRYAQLRSRLSVISHYGTNWLLLAAGVVKLLLLILLPYKFIYQIKKRLLKY